MFKFRILISTIYWINEKSIGEKRMGTMARPRGNDWLEDEIRWLRIRGVDCLVSLLEKSEEWELGLQEEGKLCEKWGIEFINFAIEDVHTPSNEKEFILLTAQLANRIKKGAVVVIHCRMGIGRSSVLAAAIMINLGGKGETVFETISQYRKLNVPDTRAQRHWLLSMEDRLKS